MKVMHRAAQLEAAGRDIVHMEVGEPDFDTAESIIVAAKRALDEGHTRYTPAPGTPALRAAISRYYAQHYGVDVASERILVTPGASAGLMLLAHLLVGPGDGVLLADPAYPCVRNFLYLVSGEPQLVPVAAAQNYQPTPALLDRHRRDNTRGLWLASPSNPTGTVLDRQRLQELVDSARQWGLHVLVDEIYHGLHYVDDLPSVLEMSQDAFVVNSFSKYFGMTGWRLGWIVVPSACVEQANILAQNLYISAPAMAQQAALTALSDETRPELERRREAFRQRGDFLATALRDMGFGLPDGVQGAFYLYADISRFSDNAEQFCQDLLETHGVALTPGTDFGDHDATRHVRFAFTTSMARLELGVERLRRALA
ncbi:MAG: aminotransferase class I/II-fold pyridoxal phosphate-dependent enzyme [Pseudohongiellaceae bacterium]